MKTTETSLLVHRLRQIEAQNISAPFLWNPFDSQYLLSGVGKGDGAKGGTIQDNTKRLYGKSDLEPNSRPSVVEKAFSTPSGIISQAFVKPHNILDICCGDAYILTHLKKKFNEIKTFGIDVAEYEYHEEAKVHGVDLFNIAIQTLIEKDFPIKFDVVMMLNSYRALSTIHTHKYHPDAEIYIRIGTTTLGPYDTKTIRRLKNEIDEPNDDARWEDRSLGQEVDGNTPAIWGKCETWRTVDDTLAYYNKRRLFTALMRAGLALEHRVNLWLSKNAKSLILTATRKQIQKLNKLGFKERVLGKGEQDSATPSCLMYLLTHD